MNQREILLVPFPFSDQSGRKVRSVIVISNNEFNDYSGDVIVVGVTSNLSKGRHTLNLSSSDLKEGKLFSLCCIKVENILRLEKGLIIKKIGTIGRKKLGDIISVLNDILEINK